MMGGMQLDTETLARLRDELLQRGARTSLLPQPLGEVAAGTPAFSADVAAVMQNFLADQRVASQQDQNGEDL